MPVIGAIGDVEQDANVESLGLEGQPGVDRVVPILKPYKLASAQITHGERTVLDIDYRPVLWGLTSRGDGDAEGHGRKRTKILSRYFGACLSRSKAGTSSGWSISLVRPFCTAFPKASAASLCFPA